MTFSTFGWFSKGIDEQQNTLVSSCHVFTVFLYAGRFLCWDPEGSTWAAMKIKSVTFSHRHVSLNWWASVLPKNYFVAYTFWQNHRNPVRSDCLITNKFTAARPRCTARGSLVLLKHSSSGQSVFSSAHSMASTSPRNVLHTYTHIYTHTVVLLNFWQQRPECGRLSFHESEAFPLSLPSSLPSLFSPLLWFQC